MWFSVNWNEGYEVCVTMHNDNGYMGVYPLRNFGDNQGDAFIFCAEDCPSLTDIQIRMLIKNFDRRIKYKRVNNRKFIRDKRYE